MRIPNLPNWCITDKKPGFYDTDSATAIKQTAKLHAAIRELQEDYNLFANEVNTKIEQFITSEEGLRDEFEAEINKLVHDYIQALDSKIAHQDRVIEESIVYIKDNLKHALSEFITELKESGELDEVITNAFNNLGTRVNEIDERLKFIENNFNTKIHKTTGVEGDLNTLTTSGFYHEVNVTNKPDENYSFRYLVLGGFSNSNTYDCVQIAIGIENLVMYYRSKKESESFGDWVLIPDLNKLNEILASYYTKEEVENINNTFETSINNLAGRTDLLETKNTTNETNITNLINNQANYKLKGDFAVISGSITMEAGSGVVYVDLPNGFTVNNCAIISCGRDYTGNGYINGTLYLQTELMAGLNKTQNKIEVTAYDPEMSDNNVLYQIVLMKI